MTRATATLAAGVGLGAGLMYYLDPNRGSRRRTHARNQVIHASHRLRDNARAQWQSLRQTSNADGDRVVAEGGRGMLGRVASLAHALKPERGLAWTNGRGASARRVATALAGAAGIGLAARAAMHARHQEFELRS